MEKLILKGRKYKGEFKPLLYNQDSIDLHYEGVARIKPNTLITNGKEAFFYFITEKIKDLGLTKEKQNLEKCIITFEKEILNMNINKYPEIIDITLKDLYLRYLKEDEKYKKIIKEQQNKSKDQLKKRKIEGILISLMPNRIKIKELIKRGYIPSQS